jgi:hypothetical protein
MNSVLSPSPRVKASRKPLTRTAKLQHLADTIILWLTVGHETTAYKLTRLPSDFGTAYRLLRADRADGQGSQQYDVCLQDLGRVSRAWGALRRGLPPLGLCGS